MRAGGYSVSGGGWDILGFRGVWCIVRHPNFVCATVHQEPSASLTAVLMAESFFGTACLDGSNPDVGRDVMTTFCIPRFNRIRVAQTRGGGGV